MGNQKGVGLVEILVALLLIAIGVLGFIALQYRAMGAGTEAANRVIASKIASNISENIRINNTQDAINAYKANTPTTVASVNCYTASTECTDVQKANFDMQQIRTYATSLGMNLAILACPATNSRTCVYVAWDTTLPNGDGTNTSCTTTSGSSFSYTTNSTCLVMEVL